jgi:hypothetical protein
MAKVDLGCLFPCRGCNGYTTEKVVVEADIKAGMPVEKVSEANGVMTVKLLTDVTKIEGVMVYNAKAGKGGDTMVSGQVNIDAIVMPDGMKAIDLTNDANQRLIFRREV